MKYGLRAGRESEIILGSLADQARGKRDKTAVANVDSKREKRSAVEHQPTERKRPAVPPTPLIPLPAAPKPRLLFQPSPGRLPQTTRDAAGFITPEIKNMHAQPHAPR